MIVIGVGGAQRAGKDTVAQYLVDNHGFVRIGLADPLKSLAASIDPICEGTLGIRMNELMASYGEDYVKENFPEYRRFLINLGQGLRAFDEDFWVDCLLAFIVAENGETGAERFVVPDVRFENEISGLQHLRSYDSGAVIESWKVYNREAEAAARATGQVTERLFDDPKVWTRTLENNSTIDALHLQVQAAIFQIAKAAA